MKEMFKELNQTRKETPKEFYGDLVVFIAAFGIMLTAIYIFG